MGRTVIGIAPHKFFVLSGRGDTLVFRDYRGDVSHGMPDQFFKSVKKWKDDKGMLPPPAFESDKVHFVFIRRNGLYFVAVTKFNVAPACALELIGRIAGLSKDYCGVLNEESIRLNFILVYELLDEVLDFGYPQGTNTEMLKSYVCNQPVGVPMDREHMFSTTGGVTRRTLPSSAANKPIAVSLDSMRVQKNEIFVDLLERMTVLVAANGNVLRSHIDGSLQMKSFFGGNAEVQFGLNEDLVIGREEGRALLAGGSVVLDDCSFHENANLTDFDRDRTITMAAVSGECTVLNYRITSDFSSSLPFRVYTTVEDGQFSKMLIVSVRIKCQVPPKSMGTNVIVRIPVPKQTVSTATDPLGPGQSTDFKQSDKVFVWKLKKMEGGAEEQLVLKLTLSEVTRSSKREISAVSLDFELPMFICSGMLIRFLRVSEKGRPTHSPFRWVRYITHSDSYVCRV